MQSLYLYTPQNQLDLKNLENPLGQTESIDEEERASTILSTSFWGTHDESQINARDAISADCYPSAPTGSYIMSFGVNYSSVYSDQVYNMTGLMRPGE